MVVVVKQGCVYRTLDLMGGFGDLWRRRHVYHLPKMPVGIGVRCWWGVGVSALGVGWSGEGCGAGIKLNDSTRG